MGMTFRAMKLKFPDDTRSRRPGFWDRLALLLIAGTAALFLGGAMLYSLALCGSVVNVGSFYELVGLALFILLAILYGFSVTKLWSSSTIHQLGDWRVF